VTPGGFPQGRPQISPPDKATGHGFYLGFGFIVDREIVAAPMLQNKFLLPWFRLDEVCCNIGEKLMRTGVVGIRPNLATFLGVCSSDKK
jgi:hypothetical protein